MLQNISFNNGFLSEFHVCYVSPFWYILEMRQCPRWKVTSGCSTSCKCMYTLQSTGSACLAVFEWWCMIAYNSYLQAAGVDWSF